METLVKLIAGFINIFQLQYIIAMTTGVILGIIVGALPGLTVTMAVALLLPFTFGVDPVTGISFLLGVYVGGIYGGSISAIMIRTPGTPAAAATVLDGYPLMKQGKAIKALKMALVASFIGGIISAMTLILVAPQLAKIALEFGPPEYFSLALFGLTIIAVVSARNLIKGLISAFFGILINTVGLDPVGGVSRFTFGISNLQSGFPLIPALIGLFAVSEIIRQFSFNREMIIINEAILSNKIHLNINDIKRSLKTIIKSSFIGTIIGAIPGAGSAIAAFLGYNEAVRSSKDPEKFGKGELEGVAAAEAANNAVTGSTLIPLLTLGVPGDTVTAVLLGALMIQGLRPGPLLFEKHIDIVYSLFASIIVINIIMLIIASIGIKWFAKIAIIPIKILMPIILVLCFVGSYSVSGNIYDIEVVIGFGILGYFMQKYDFPVTPLLLANILGPMAERGLRQSLGLSQGSLSIFFTRPITVILLILTVISLLIPFFINLQDLRKRNSSN
jgi:putative tricarboxylic transport membrane protein